MGSGSTKYTDGFVIRKHGNRKVNGTIEANVEVFYVGEDDGNCTNHIRCCDGNLCWYYCDGTSFGIIEKCDFCEDNECISKGSLNNIREQDPQIILENWIRSKDKSEVDCRIINGTEIGTECLG